MARTRASMVGLTEPDTEQPDWREAFKHLKDNLPREYGVVYCDPRKMSVSGARWFLDYLEQESRKP